MDTLIASSSPDPPRGSFVTWLLNLIRTHCEPGRLDWEPRLERLLRQELESPFRDDSPLSPDLFNRLLWRIGALERDLADLRLLMQPPPPAPREELESQ